MGEGQTQRFWFKQITNEMLEELHLACTGKVRENRKAAEVLKQKYDLPQQVHYILNKFYQWRRAQEIGGTLPQEPDPVLPEIVEIPYADRPWVSDLHLPYVHTRALTDFLAWSDSRGYKELVIGGDLIDFTWCSKWPSGYSAGNAPQVSAEIEYCYDILRAMCGVFKKIYWIPGNHDARPVKALAMKLEMSHWQRLFLTKINAKGIVIEDLSPCFELVKLPQLRINGGPTGDWMICHQTNYRKTPGSVAAELCTKYEMNVVSTHEHVGAIVPSKTSCKWQGVASHCMADPKKVEYKHTSVSLHNNWTIGWGWWEDGVGHLHRWDTPDRR